MSRYILDLSKEQYEELKRCFYYAEASYCPINSLLNLEEKLRNPIECEYCLTFTKDAELPQNKQETFMFHCLINRARAELSKSGDIDTCREQYDFANLLTERIRNKLGLPPDNIRFNETQIEEIYNSINTNNVATN